MPSTNCNGCQQQKKTYRCYALVQSAAGKVATNRRATLAGVSVDQASFTLAPGAETQVNATLAWAPSAGYLYGALKVVGIPTDASKRKGVVLGYRLVGALRITPAAAQTGLTAGKPKAVQGTGGAAAQEQRQHARPGQRLDPRQERPRDQEQRACRGQVLPGKSINVPLGTKLARGLHGHGEAQTARQDGPVGDEEVHGPMSRVRSTCRRLG